MIILYAVLVFTANSRLANSQDCQALSDPCLSKSWQDKTEPERDWNSTVQGERCDRDLKSGWYRFLNPDGSKIAIPVKDCALPDHGGRYRCGTLGPSFIKASNGAEENPRPEDGVVTRKPCVSVAQFDACCASLIPWDVCVRHCGDEGLIYYLQPTKGCPVGFCTDSRRPVACKEGDQLIDGTCVDQFPIMITQPVITVNFDLSYRNSEITFQCHLPLVNVSANSRHLRVEFKVAWFRDGQKIMKTTLKSPGRDKEMIMDMPTMPISGLFMKSEKPVLGFDVQCAVRVTYSKGKFVSEWSQSNIFYAGLKAKPDTIRVPENHPISEPKQITLHSTVPTVCKPNKTHPYTTCAIDFDSSLGNFSDQTDVLTDWCNVTIEGGSNVSQPLGVSAVRDAIEDGVRKHEVVFSTKYVVSRTPLEWVGHPPVRVKVLSENVRSPSCYSVTYGHYKTFDDQSFDFASRGEFTLVGSKTSTLRIHSRVWPCPASNRNYSCTCGVAVLEGSDLVVVDLCQWQDKERARIRSLPVRVSRRSKERLGRSMKVFSSKQGTNYKIETLSGTIIQLSLNDFGLNTFIRIPEDLYNSTTGLCGNNNANPQDDFQGPNGTLHSNINKLGLSWRVHLRDSLFTRLITSPHSNTQDSLHCQCTDQSNKHTSFLCNSQLIRQPKTLIADTNWLDISHQIKSVSSLSGISPSSADITDTYDFRVVSLPAGSPSFPTDSGITKPAARRHCRNMLLNSIVARRYRVTVTEIIGMCIKDIMWSDSLEQSRYLLPVLIQKYEMSVFSRFSLWSQFIDTKSGLSTVLQPPPFTQTSLCLSNCSSHGSCEDTVCVCESGYTGDDCSVQLNAPPRLFDFANNGVCDYNKEPCSLVYILGDGFINSKNLQCMVFDDPDDRQLQRTFTVFKSQREVYCNLTLSDKMKAIDAVDIAVTNNGGMASNRITYVRYDSNCVECSKLGDCPIKSGTCLIDNRCFVENDVSESRWCDQCRPSESQTSWSTRGDNIAPLFLSRSRSLTLIPGDVMTIQLQGSDPEEKNISYQVRPLSKSGMSLSPLGLWQWSVPTDTKLENHKFTFYVVDQCGLKSEPLNLRVTVQSCPCQNKGRCRKHPKYAVGSGRYSCRCTDGYAGKQCEMDINECASNPCFHRGRCVDIVNGYTCNCLAGYTGVTCQINIDECLSTPCTNDGTCVDDVNGFRCECPGGYAGHTCNVDIKECESSPCVNGGECIDGVNLFSCECSDGYAGYTCDVNVIECASSPCVNGGKCIDGVNLFTCKCLGGFTGHTCAIDIDECESFPCVNGGECIDDVNLFSCECSDGYSGYTCDVDIDECESSPCVNGGKCIDDVNSFSCECSDGYTGYTCDIDIDECASSPCVNGGKCIDGINLFSCECSDGFTGYTCNVDINECESSPCVNSGKCIDGVNLFSCDCSEGYTGYTCHVNINECASSPCVNGGKCIDGVNLFSCECSDGFAGYTCNVDINECESSPCVNSGKCIDAVNLFSCECSDGYAGYTCDVDTDECASSPCVNDGKCIDGVNLFTCKCPGGFTGHTCNVDIDECESSPCVNGGECIDHVNLFSCECSDGYTGYTCDVDIDECASDPCVNRGKCIDGVNLFSCECSDGYDGHTCEVNINECASSPCVNGGKCIDDVNLFTCECSDGYTGYTCDVDINECKSSPCVNSGKCIDGVNLFSCECSDGYAGYTCDVDIDECESSPCVNGGKCMDGVNLFTCECSDGYTGYTCDVDIGECESSPCVNGGKCIDGVNLFSCECIDGFTGYTCDVNIDECASSPCVNGGECIDHVNLFSCDCSEGYTGYTCDVNVNECASSPCVNGGKCIDGVNLFTCECPGGFTGHTCNVDIDECESSPCVNGGECIDGINMFSCLCQRGYTGIQCGSIIDNCQSFPCANGGICHNHVATFTCECLTGFTGETCMGEIDYCASQPCFGQVTCTNFRDRFECGDCPVGFFGDGLTCNKVHHPDIVRNGFTGNHIVGRDFIALPGSTILIDCVANGAPEPTIQWSADGRRLQSNHRVTLFQNGTLKITRVETRDSRKYTCTATNMGGSAIRNSAVTVGVKPNITLDFEVNGLPTASTVMQFIGYPVAVLVDKKVKIICLAEGIPTPTFKWTKNGHTLVSRRRMLLRRNILMIAPVDENDSGQYTCTVSNVIGTDQMSSTVDVLTPPTIRSKGQCHLEDNMLVIGLNSSLPAGQSLGLCCAVTGNPHPQLSWYKGSKKMAWNGTMLMIKNASINDSGMYRCSGTNEFGQDSKNSIITVTEPVSVTVVPQGRVAIFAGQSIEISCSAVGHPRPTMQWITEPQETPVTATNRLKLSSVANGLKLAVKNARIEDSQTFSCAARDYYGEIIKETVTFVVNPARRPVIAGNTVGSSLVAWPGSTILIDCVANGAPDPTIQWSANGKRLTNNTRFTLYPNGTLKIVNAEVDDGGKYTCTATNVGGSAERNTALTVGEKPTIMFHIQLPVNPTSSSVRQFVGHPVAVLLGKNLRIICQASGIPTPTIHWKKDGDTLVSSRRMLLKGVNLLIHRIDESDSGQYTCVASNVVGSDQLSSTVDVWVPPAIIVDEVPVPGPNHFLIGSNGNTTVGQSIIVLCPVSGNPQPAVTWYKESQTKDLIEIAWNVTTLAINNITLADDGTYRCSAVNTVGMESRQSTITVTDPVRLIVNPGSHVVALYGQTVEITCTAVGYPLPTAVQWVTEPDGAPVLESYKIRLQSIEHRSKLIVKNVLPKDSQAFSCTSRDHKGRAIKEIVTMDVFERNCSTDSYYWNRTYETGMQYAVVVFLTKETSRVTTTMKEWLPNAARRIDEELLERGIGINEPNQYSVVGFGGEKPMRVIKVNNQRLYTIDSVNEAVQLLKSESGPADGFHGIVRLLKDLPFPRSREYITSLLLVTDQPRQVSHIGRLTKRQRVDKVLGNRTVTFSCLLNMEYHFTTDDGGRSADYDALVVDSSVKALVATRNGKFFTYEAFKLTLQVDKQKCAMLRDYGELALKHHGFMGDFAAAIKTNGMDASMTNAVAVTMANSIAAYTVCERCVCKSEGIETKKLTCWRPKDQYWCECKLRKGKGCHKAGSAVHQRDMAFNVSSILPESCQ